MHQDEQVVACLRAAWELSTYAASIHWDGGRNGREWLAGFREHIEDVQAKLEACAPHVCRGAMPVCGSSVDRMIESAESYD